MVIVIRHREDCVSGPGPIVGNGGAPVGNGNDSCRLLQTSDTVPATVNHNRMFLVPAALDLELVPAMPEIRRSDTPVS